MTLEDRSRLVLLTGATGYVGGRLLRRLEEHGERVRCLTRRSEALVPHRDSTTIVAGDVLDIESLGPAMDGVETAYYLVHSMGSAGSFEEEDRLAAHNFATAAHESGVRRIVYLGGLGAGGDLSSHLASRQEVGGILAGTGVQTIEFRASIVIGSGSLSFEIIRKLVERLPVMVTPRWVRTVAQPGRTPSPQEGSRRRATGGVPHGKRLVDSRSVSVPVSPAQAFRPIRRVGGDTGWYFANRLWRLRGFLDLLAGGVGLRRGRRDPDSPTPGSALDFWRVEAFEPDHLPRLRAEMKLPGRAWLQFEVDGDDARSTIRQTAIFHPTGLLGTGYWYGLFPFHSWIFAGMLKAIAREARQPDVVERLLTRASPGPNSGG